MHLGRAALGRETTGKVMRLAKRVVLDLYGRPPAPGRRGSQGAARPCATIRSGASAPGHGGARDPEAAVARDADGWDADPWALNVMNGTLDLRTGTLREHRREDHLTKLAPVDYDPKATLELWKRFLSDATGADAEMSGFLQRFFGYTLTGDTSEEKLALILGPEAKGNWTFIEAVKGTLGDYAMTADFETFLKRPATGGPPERSRPTGRCPHGCVDRSRGWEGAGRGHRQGHDEGGDTVTARLLYQEHFEYVPAFTLWLAANHAPRVRDDDGAMWRRIMRIPFEHTIAKDKRDPKVKATLRNSTLGGPAILAWAVQGCLEWQRDGLGVPQSVTDGDRRLPRGELTRSANSSPTAAWWHLLHGRRCGRCGRAIRTGRRATAGHSPARRSGIGSPATAGPRARRTGGGRIRKGIGLAADGVTDGDSENITPLDARGCRDS